MCMWLGLCEWSSTIVCLCGQVFEEKVTALPWLENRPVEPLPPVSTMSKYAAEVLAICWLNIGLTECCSSCGWTKSLIQHSAWSESSAACPRPRGGHRKGEKLARGAFAMLERWGPKGRADELVFGGVWSKTPNSSPRRLAIWCFQGNQYVTLSSSVLFRIIALQQTVLPPSCALILCAIARKSSIITDFS